MTSEDQLLTHLLSDDNIKGDPTKVLHAIEEYKKTVRHLMIVGPDKGQYIIDLINSNKPKIAIELGCYVGYSATKFGAEVSKYGGKFYGFEYEPKFADITNQVTQLANLSSTVDIYTGAASETLPEFAKAINGPVDLIFIDHAKELYVADFRVLESLGLITKGTIIVADNILRPGVPEYHKYVNLSSSERQEYNESVVNEAGAQYKGKSSNVYESQLVKVGSDGIEITKCIDS